MNEWDAWIYLDGPEPAVITEAVALARAEEEGEVKEVSPLSEEEAEALSQRVMERIRAQRATGAEEKLEDEGEGEDSSSIQEEREPEPPAVVVAPIVAVMGPEVPPVALTTSLSVEIPPELRARPRVTPIVTEENAAKRAPRTVRCEISRHHAGWTAPVGDDTLEKVVASVLPFVRAAEEAKQEVNGSALTLYQYASLLVELRAGGERASVLARYQVEGEAGLERLVACWEERMARRPALRKEIEEAMETWADYLRKVRGGPGG